MDLTKYYTEICKEPILSKEEELSLLTEYSDSTISENRKEEIRNRVIKANLRFAFKQAKNYSKNDPAVFGELISAANEGLMIGLTKYKPDRNVRFLSYAGWWVIQRILEEMSNMRIVSLPKGKQQLASKIGKLVEGNSSLKLSELKELFKGDSISDKDIEEMYRTRYLTYYIDDLDEENFLIDPIADEVQKKMDETKMWRAVNSLPSPHRELIARSFGLEDGEEYSPTKLSRTLRINKADIQRLKQEGLDMLKELML